MGGRDRGVTTWLGGVPRSAAFQDSRGGGRRKRASMAKGRRMDAARAKRLGL